MTEGKLKDRDRKQEFQESSVMMVKFVMYFMIIIIIMIYLYFGMISRTGLSEREPFCFIDSWTVYDGEGDSFTVGRSYIADKDYKDGTVISARLPQDIRDNEYLVFDNRKDITVYVNGELRRDFVEKRDVNIPGGSIKTFIMMVPLKGADRGTEVRMELTATEKDDQLVPKSFISTGYGVYNYLMKSEGLSFFLASIVLIFSMVVFVVSVVLRFWYKLEIDMMYGALGIFIIASWIITDSYLFPFIFGVYYVNGIINYLLSLMIPFALAVYLNSIQRGRYKRSMPLIMTISCINAVIWPILHFTGVLPLYSVRNVVNFIFVLLAAASIVLLIVDAVRGNAGRYRYTFTGFFGFLICGLIELIMIILMPNTGVIPMVIGLAFLLVFIVIQQVDDLRSIDMEKRRAVEISEAKTRFLASMSHEIRTPINAILGMNEMILRENDDEVIEDYSRSIKTSGKMLLMLVNDVLDFSRIEAGKLEINEARFHLSEMLRDVIALVKEQADEKNLELKNEFADDIPEEMVSDEFRIRQILVNLINNAVKYTEKGSVTLKLNGTYDGDERYLLSITVSDTGKGIRKEEQAHLFEAFTRADEKANINIEGTGLGLAIVKSIVDSMKGTVEVKSEYGVGSEFTVKLPVGYIGREAFRKELLDMKPGYDKDEDVCDYTAPEAKILAVDDNQSNLTIVRLFLKRTGIVPDLCSSGMRAVQLCREKRYDLILLDHMMPAPDGIETLHMIRADENTLNRDTVAVVLTANAVAGSRRMYIDEGFEDYLTKPLDSKVLEQTVKRLLPEEKVLDRQPAEEDEPMEFFPAGTSPLRIKISSISGMDYDTALRYCGGDEESLQEILNDVVSDCAPRCERMKKSLEAGDIKAYEIDAHSLKSAMATIGVKELSERAKKHEFAAKADDREFILSDADGLIEEYRELCRKLES